jgi:predicted ABC-class ATPase
MTLLYRRWIEGVNISPFIKNLPFGTDTMAFSTTNASGSTSMAASIQEMVEGQSKLFLYDEDTCATNFLVTDRRMRQLVNRNHEPIIPLTSRIKQLYNDMGVSSIMVTGACFDFLELADLVIEIRNYVSK